MSFPRRTVRRGASSSHDVEDRATPSATVPQFLGGVTVESAQIGGQLTGPLFVFLAALADSVDEGTFLDQFALILFGLAGSIERSPGLLIDYGKLRSHRLDGFNGHFPPTQMVWLRACYL